jgi:hypothetical protein
VKKEAVIVWSFQAHVVALSATRNVEKLMEGSPVRSLF